MKRLLALKIAKEAQRELYKRVTDKKAHELKLKEEEERKKRQDEVIQIEEMPDMNNNINTLQKMVSMSGMMFNEPLTGQVDTGGIMGYNFNDEPANEDPFFAPMNDVPDQQPPEDMVFGNDNMVGFNDYPGVDVVVQPRTNSDVQEEIKVSLDIGKNSNENFKKKNDEWMR
jgi:hypothetical protein